MKSVFLSLVILGSLAVGLTRWQKPAEAQQANSQPGVDGEKRNQIKTDVVSFDFVTIARDTLFVEGEGLTQNNEGLVLDSAKENGSLTSQAIKVPIDLPEPFLVIRPTWEAESPDDATMSLILRASTDGHSWGDWLEVRRDHDSVNKPGFFSGVSLFLDKNTSYVQFRFSMLRNQQGDSPVIARLHLRFFSPGASQPATLLSLADKTQQVSSSEYLAAVSKPDMVSRTGWGCPDGESSPTFPTTDVKHLIVHHTDNETNTILSDWPAVVKYIWYDHTYWEGWGDIGYNYLIDPNGVIYVGRGGGEDIRGDHFSCANTGTMGVALLGKYSTVAPSAAAMASLKRLLAWKASQKGIDPEGSTDHDSSQLTLKNISGHRDANGSNSPTTCDDGTVCPGDALYNLMGTIRHDVRNMVEGVCGGVSVPFTDWRGAYYNNRNLSGAPAMISNDGTWFLDFEWGNGSPGGGCGIGADNFSVSWTRTVNLNAGGYRFTVTADDGVRLFIDGQNVLDKWFDQPRTTYTVNIPPLSQGQHALRMDYYENGYAAVAKLSWEQTSSTLPTITGYTWTTTPTGTQPFSGTITGTNFIVGGTQVWFCVNGTNTCYQQPPSLVTVNNVSSLSVSNVSLSAGSWQIYVQTSAGASVRSTVFTVQAAPTNCIASVPSANWKGEYFNNRTLTGSPLMVRDDGTSALNFDWGGGSPSTACGLPIDNFSARWTRSVNFAAGTYRFTASGDDGLRLYVDGQLKINGWVDQPETTYTANVVLTAGNHDLKYEYYEAGGGAVARLSWVLVTGALPTVSTYSWTTTPIASQNFSGSINGTNFVAGSTQVFFCVNGGSTCNQHPSAGVVVNSATSLSVSNVNLSAGSWQIYVQTAAGASTRSTAFTVQNAPTGCISTVSTANWKGEYFNNRTLTGSPVMVRDDGAASLNFDWGGGSPNTACSLPIDSFSVRWTRTVSFAAGTYRFTASGDDGLRLYVDGQLRIDRWVDQPETTYTADVTLTAGNHDLRYEYYEAGGGAVARLSWVLSTSNVAPTAAFTMSGGGKSGANLQTLSYTVPVGGNVAMTFNGTSSSPGTGSITQYAWTSNGTSIGSGQSTFNFTFGRGTHNIQLTVTNSAGLSNSTTAIINVTEQASAPTAAFTMSGGGQSGVNGQSLSFTVPTGGNVTITFNGAPSSAGTGSITQWAWTSNGTAISNQSSFSYTFGAGTHNIQLTVTNSAGLTNSTTAVIRVTQQAVAPTATFTMSGGGRTGVNGQTLSFTVPTGGNVAMTFNGTSSLAGTGSITRWEWSSNNTVISNQSSFSFTFGPGTHNIRLTVTNSANLSNSATAVIGVTEQAIAPTAAFTMSGGGRTGTNGQSLSFTVPIGGSVAISFNGTSSSAGTGSITQWVWTSNGTAISNQSSFSYTFGAGTHNIQLSVTNSAGLTSSTTAVIGIVAQATTPTISGYAWNTTPTGSQYFSGTITGTNFVANGTQVWFCVNGTSTCYQQPISLVSVTGSSSLNVTNVSLSTGLWQIYVQTSAGASARSSAFTVR